MAITLTVAQLRTALGLGSDVTDEVDASVTDEVDASVTDEVVASLLAVASELVNKEGGEDAPDAISDEAVILVAAHLEDRIPGRLQTLDIGPVKLQLRAVGSAARLSGARALLSPWFEKSLPVEPED